MSFVDCSNTSADIISNIASSLSSNRVLATGLFSSPRRMAIADYATTNVGWFYEWGRGSGNFTLMGIQICAVLFVFGWTITVFTPFCYILKWLNWLRIDPLEEEVGMDISRHKGSAYQSEGSNHEAVAELNASRRNLVNDLSSSGKGGNSFYSKSFKRAKDLEKKEDEDKPADENLGGSEHAREEEQEA